MNKMNKKGVWMLIIDNVAGFLLILAAAFILIVTVQANDVSQKIVYQEKIANIESQEALNHFVQRMVGDASIAELISNEQDFLVLQEAQDYFEAKFKDKSWKFVILHPNRLAQETGDTILGTTKSASVFIPGDEGNTEVYLLKKKTSSDPSAIEMYGLRGMRSVG